MTADFENDEIKDSSFPIDFNDDTASLDMYGVWVKSGPRDAEGRGDTEREASTASMTFTDSIDVQKQGAQQDEFIDLADLPELPDFDIEDTGVVNPDVEEITESIDFEDIEIEPTEETAEVSVADDFSDIVQDISFDEIDFDEPLVEHEVAIVEPEETVESLDILENLEPEIELALPTERPQVESLEIESHSEEEFSLEEFLPQDEEKPVLPSDEDFSSFLDDLNGSPTPRQSATGVVDELDLDSFINSVNESGGALNKEEEKLYDDSEPLNIDLEFDESFIEDAEKIRATGSSVSESEFFNSEFGVELVDETTGSGEDLSDSDLSETGFDAMFGSADSSAFEQKPRVSAQDTSDFLEETSEFDDLLKSLDAAPVPAPVSDSKASSAAASKAATKSFDLMVTEEDGFEAIVPSVSESVSDDDINVPLFGSSTPIAEMPSTPEKKIEDAVVTESIVEESGIITAEEPFNIEEIVDITEIKDYNRSESEPASEDEGLSSLEDTVSLDFDDISAVEKELSEQTPETGEDTVVANDKSTELLMIIADELSSIKKEISTLKSELSGFKSGAVPEQTLQQEGGAVTENSGFFSDDDTDETIALTGDELNNILITADFTEEKSEEPVSEELSEMSEPLTVDLNVSPEPTIEEVEPEVAEVEEALEDHEIPETLPETIFDVPGFEAEEPVEVSHINTINDDISYLDGSDSVEPDLDNVAIEEPELEIIDFDDEKLEEPELTEFNIDLSDMETVFPPEQEVAVSDENPVEELGIPEEVPMPEVEDFASTDTLTEQELAAVGDDIVLSEAELTGKTTEAVARPTDNLEATVKEPAGRGTGVSSVETLPVELKDEIKSVLSYMDQLLESLPEEKIEEFARSEHFEVYKKLFEELGIS